MHGYEEGGCPRSQRTTASSMGRAHSVSLKASRCHELWRRLVSTHLRNYFKPYISRRR
jgi:hypothetical protein